jgi:hypothetical protein
MAELSLQIEEQCKKVNEGISLSFSQFTEMISVMEPTPANSLIALRSYFASERFVERFTHHQPVGFWVYTDAYKALKAWGGVDIPPLSKQAIEYLHHDCIVAPERFLRKLKAQDISRARRFLQAMYELAISHLN